MTAVIKMTENKNEFDINEIKDFLPHRYPFLLIDKVKDVISGESAVGIKCVTSNEQFFQGHFPGNPIMPGVLIIESLAQTAAIVVLDFLQMKDANKKVYFMTIEEARFRKPVIPGDYLELHVQKIRNRNTVWKFKGEAIVDGQVVAEATYSAMIMD